MNWSDRLVGSCDDGMKWARTQPSLVIAWKNCRRWDWMLWLIRQTAPERMFRALHHRLVGVAVAAARTALPHAGKWHPEIERGLRVLARFTRGVVVSRQEILEECRRFGISTRRRGRVQQGREEITEKGTREAQ